MKFMQNKPYFCEYIFVLQMNFRVLFLSAKSHSFITVICCNTTVFKFLTQFYESFQNVAMLNFCWKRSAINSTNGSQLLSSKVFSFLFFSYGAYDVVEIVDEILFPTYSSNIISVIFLRCKKTSQRQMLRLLILRFTDKYRVYIAHSLSRRTGGYDC